MEEPAQSSGGDHRSSDTAPISPAVGSALDFLGYYEPRLDDKGRLFLPARFRPLFENGLVVTPGQEHCLFVFTKEGFHQRFASLAGAPLSDPSARNAQRWFLANASAETPDKQGRITIPLALREWARLTKDCVVVGAGKRCEIWDKQTWQAAAEDSAADFAGFSQGGEVPTFEV